MDASTLSALVRFDRARSFQELADCAMELIGNPIILFDMNERILAITGSAVNDQYFTELQKTRSVPREQSKNLEWARALRSMYTEPHAALTEFNGLSMLTRGLLVGGVPVGHLHATAYFRPFTEDDLALVDLMAPRLALELYQRLSVDAAQRSSADTFLQSLLSGQPFTPETISVKLSLLGWQPGGALYVLCLDRFAGGDLHALASELLCGPHDRYTTYENHAVIILSRTRPLSPDDRAALRACLEQIRAACGLSRELSSLHELHTGYEQALAACRIGARVRPEKFLHEYDVCLPYALIDRVSQSEDALPYVQPALLRLASDDRRTGGGLMATLHTYLACGRSVQRAAAKLGVHKNTVSFRLGKIADALNLDWSDAEDVYRLMHSVSILEYTDCERFFGG